MKTAEKVRAQGHENILSTNKTTFEITKDTHLTKRGLHLAGNRSVHRVAITAPGDHRKPRGGWNKRYRIFTSLPCGGLRLNPRTVARNERGPGYAGPLQVLGV